MIDIKSSPAGIPIGAQVAPDVASAALVDDLRGYAIVTILAMAARKHRLVLLLAEPNGCLTDITKPGTGPG